MKVFRLSALALAASLAASATRAEDVATYYQGRSLSLLVGFASGGAADAHARLLARYYGKHIPGNPTVVVRNMQGVGSLVAANHVFNISPKDGSEVGFFAGNIVIEPLIGELKAKYDSRRFAWIGSPTAQTDICVASKKSGIQRFDELFTREMVTGATGSSSLDFPLALNSVLHTRLKVVRGYNGTAALRLALERGEIDGYCAALDTIRTAGVTDELITILLQFGLQRNLEIADVPSVMDYAKAQEDRQVIALITGWTAMARPIAAPPGTPPERVQALRDAFDATMANLDFRAEAAKASLSIAPTKGGDIQGFVEDVYRTPKHVADRAAVILERTGK